MIISQKGDKLVLVRQHDHGALAGQLVRHWGNEMFEKPHPLESVFHATRHHDRGWQAADAEPLYDPEARRPRNFLKRATEEHVKFYGGAVEELIQEDPYAGLLVSMHWTGLYNGRWGMAGWRVDAEGDEQRYLEEVARAAEDRWAELKRLAWNPQECSRPDFEQRLWHNYKLLQAYDLLSLYICRRVFESEPYTVKGVPLRPGLEHVDIQLQPLGDGRVAVDPFPFQGDSFVGEVMAREIPDRDYASAEDVAATLASVEPITIRCEYVRVR